MKSLGILTAALAVLVVAGCKSTAKESDGMMSGKNGGAVSTKKEGQCPFEAAAKKDDCCASEAKSTEVKKSGCCAEGKTEVKSEKSGCCAEGKTEAKAKGTCDDAKITSGCCKGKAVSAACADCKTACEKSGSCDAGKKCDDKPCEEKPKP